MKDFFQRLLSQPSWRLSTIMWCGFALLFFARLSFHLSLPQAAVFSLFQLSLCLLLVAVLRFLYQRLEGHSKFGINTAAWIVGLSLGATIVQSCIAHSLLSVTGWHDPGWSLLELWLMRLMFFWLVFLLWSLFYFWVRAEEIATTSRQREAEALAAGQRMELQLLRSQLDPHFLFNALNGIAAVAPSDSTTAAAMARELADYLRYSLDHRHDAVVPLSQEIEAMTAYLRIEQARFPDELHVQISAEPAASRREVPCFILLPLVENAVKHSLRTWDPPWELSIAAGFSDGVLVIEVHNSGILDSEKPGVGLEVLRRRLDLHYPGHHKLTLVEEQGKVVARMELEGAPCSA